MLVAVNFLRIAVLEPGLGLTARWQPQFDYPGRCGFNAAISRMALISRVLPQENRTPRIRAAAGLTLIEIIMALAILGIVAASDPGLRGYVTEAKLGTAIKDIRQMELILNDACTWRIAPPATLAAAGINMTDPGESLSHLWLRGNPDGSVNGNRRRDKSMNPVNSDYDLYSMGPRWRDGKAVHRGPRRSDDVVRANDVTSSAWQDH